MSKIKKMADNFCKYYKMQKQVSYDGGGHWQNLDEYQKGELYESYSQDCGVVIQYRWVIAPNDYICSGTTKCAKEKKQVSYDNAQTWSDVSPAEYRTGAVIEYQSTDCGYVPPMERWVTTYGFTCSGTTKMTREKEQKSDDSGVTWYDTNNYREGSTVLQYNSADCGYVPQPPSSAYTTQYLTIVSNEDSNIIYYKNTDSVTRIKQISASTDGGSTWTAYTPDESGEAIAILNQGEKLFLKANSAQWKYLRLYALRSYDVEGNIMSMEYGDDFQNKTSLQYTSSFENMFKGSTTLHSAENLILPATTLSGSCYQEMFAGCTSLVTPPYILPATTLAPWCYQNMFGGCTSLTTAPQLPATTLANYCYEFMFNGCTSLTSVPRLPATTLANWCYAFMFSGCTSITAAPELPATTLAEECYEGMFRYCTSLTVSPELPATTLAKNCYHTMFLNCTSLAVAPELPATTLVDGCYGQMFSMCGSLAVAPELPATTLVYACYNAMFTGCTSLNYIKCLATDISASVCTFVWLKDVSSSGTFIKASSMNDWTTGASGIPSGWTIQNA